MKYIRNPHINSEILPVDIVFHPSWWFKNAGIIFDQDFFYHPLKRVEVERSMEHELYERFGRFGLGRDRLKDMPVIGAIHNAAGYLLSEMLGCKIVYEEGGPPQVIPAGFEKLEVDVDAVFQSSALKRLINLIDKLKTRYGYVTGDVNWGGVLNLALDLIGEKAFMDFYTDPEETKKQFQLLANVIEKFVTGISEETGTSSISVNRNVMHIEKPVFLHSECSHTMISTEQYEEFLLPVDLEWSRKFRPFGIHYCGNDPHRYADVFSKMGNLDFLDVGWGGDVKKLREKLPDTFLNLRLDPVSLNNYSDEELRSTITRLIEESGNPYLTGVCCINMDDKTEDSKINTIFHTLEELKQKYAAGESI